MIRPIIATAIMTAVSYLVYTLALGIVGIRMSCIIAIIVAVFVYFISVVLLKIFSKEDILMLPKGEKIYNFLKKTKIYE